MALVFLCSTPPISSFRFRKRFPISKPSVSETLIPKIHISNIPKMWIFASASNRSGQSLQRSCCMNSATSIKFSISPSTTVFLKGLPRSASEESLKTAFSEFGEVSRVKIVMDKKTRESLGFGYVWFTDEESAQMAVREMNGKFFEGRFVFVTLAKPGSSRSLVRGTTYKF